MELGGNAPFIVFDDADIDEAVQGAIAAKFRNAGQTCVCPNRFLVQEKVAATFVEKLVTATKQLKVGDGMEQGVQIGPLINQVAKEQAVALVVEAVAKGAKIAYRTQKDGASSCFLDPIVLTGVTSAMRISREEIFGPVATIQTFNTEEEAIASANDTEFGLASYLYAKDINRIVRVSEALEFGIVGINEALISNAAAPFGGMKESGQGREGSKYGLDDYLEVKYLCLGGVK